MLCRLEQKFDFDRLERENDPARDETVPTSVIPLGVCMHSFRMEFHAKSVYNFKYCIKPRRAFS